MSAEEVVAALTVALGGAVANHAEAIANGLDSPAWHQTVARHAVNLQAALDDASPEGQRAV